MLGPFGLGISDANLSTVYEHPGSLATANRVNSIRKVLSQQAKNHYGRKHRGDGYRRAIPLHQAGQSAIGQLMSQ
ncbi:hypothetical protein KR51_00021030 [Rubidibacter lacunae KORDI 51-2]|uniref:Uncharacterized protein n=1 Tax=Rubidibacter lacunae KORDI 51-2 TaxID=582515 RepID=U5DK64_9CHRO|nr:hypothetical protein KR51_00021030 [Rubidibacter lacunae KORDI 51-2]